MNEEIEIRVKLKNPEKAERKIQEKAEFIEEIKQKDEYFVPAHKNFFNKAPTDKYLRIRHQKGEDEVGFHLCHYEDGELLSADEYETQVESPEEMSEIFSLLGMEKKVTVKKNRKIFETENYEVVLDKVEGLGYFMEIEVKNREGSERDARRGCFEFLEELDIEHEKTSEGGYCDKLIQKKSLKSL